MKKILIIEDDQSLCLELATLLENSGYQPFILKEFHNAKEKIFKLLPDLILLDINIPYINGELLLQEIRKESNLPVIMVTSRNTEIDEVLSISYGADDYITKPYNPTILLLSINVQKGIIIRGSQEVVLTKNEMIIFNYLLNNQNRIVTRDELMTDLWNNNEYINDNALTVNISRLRTKLREVGYEEIIQTRKGQGYILV